MVNTWSDIDRWNRKRCADARWKNRYRYARWNCAIAYGILDEISRNGKLAMTQIRPPRSRSLFVAFERTSSKFCVRSVFKREKNRERGEKKDWKIFKKTLISDRDRMESCGYLGIQVFFYLSPFTIYLIYNSTER